MSTKQSSTEITVTITNGAELTYGAWVEMKTVGPWFTAESAGFYMGVSEEGGWAPDDEEPYHLFRDGHINGIKQDFFGHPVRQMPEA